MTRTPDLEVGIRIGIEMAARLVEARFPERASTRAIRNAILSLREKRAT